MSNDELEKQLDNQENNNKDEELDIINLLNSSNEKTEENDDLEDIINILNSSEDDLIDLEGANSNVFEGLSKEELDKLTQLDEELNVDDIETDVINNISVYDEKEVDEDDVLKRMEETEEQTQQIENQEEELEQIPEPTEEKADQSLDQVLETLDQDNKEIEEEVQEEPEEKLQEVEEPQEQQNDDLEQQLKNLGEEDDTNEDIFNLQQQDDDLNLIDSQQQDKNKGKKEKNPKKEKKQKKQKLEIGEKKDKTTGIIIATIVLLIILIIITIVSFGIAITKANKIAIQKQVEADIAVSKYVPEDKNTVYFEKACDIDGETLVLEKVHINSIYTTFYFKNNINPMKYNIILTDEQKNVYPMDLKFTKNGNEENSTIIRFAPIDGKIKNFMLTFESLETGQKAEFALNFDATLQQEKVKYINSDITNDLGDYCININYAQFSPSSTRIDYTIEGKEDATYEIQQGSLGETNYVKLKEGETYIEPLALKPLAVNIDKNKIIGRMDFKNITTDGKNLVLKFEDMYKKYTINQKVSLTEIRNGKLSYNVDNYKIFLEGMPNFNNTYVLVAHAEDTTIDTTNRPDDFNHIEVQLDVELIATNGDGMEVIISPAEIKSEKIGTDTIFKLDDSQYSIINGTNANNVFVNIKSILIKSPDVGVPINLSRAMDRELVSHQMIEEQIKDAFISRINGNPTGFTPDVASNENLKREYDYLKNLKKKSSIDFICKNIDRDNLDAIIQETIQIEEKDGIRLLYRTHKIKASNQDHKWTIYYDEIIK